MPKTYPAFIENLKTTDAPFYEGVTKLFDLAMAPGELDGRTKILLTMALDALAGAPEGVRVLAKVARGMGVTDGQIAEAMRLVYLVAGNKVLETTNAAFGEA